MRQLTGLDASFLYMETPNAPMHISGPPIPLYNTGAKMVATYGTGPVQDGLGLFIAIGSYCGEFIISVTCCRDMMPDPAFYSECLQESFDELLAAVGETA